jgi:hypothetical protein
MNDAGTMPRHMLVVRELTAEAFAPYGQVIAPLRTGGHGAETSHDPEASASEAKLRLGQWRAAAVDHASAACRAQLHPDRTASAGHAVPGVARRQRMADRRGTTWRP